MKLLLAALLCLPLSLFAQGGLPDRPYIYVEGEAGVVKPADMVTLRFSLTAQNADQAKANQEVQANATKVLGMLDARKIAEKDVTAENLQSAPEYDGEGDTPRTRGKLIGYSVTRDFSVEIRDVSIFPKLVDELLAIPGTEFSRIDSDLSNEKEMETEVEQKALTNARERAERTLNAMGMKIDSVFAVSPVAFPEISSKIFGSSSSGYATTARELASSQYRLAPVSVTQSVHVIYLISPAK